MDDQAMVMSGEWRCGADGYWEFLIDKQRYGRVVTVKDGMSLTDLKEACLSEFFGMGNGEYAVNGLSYWSPNSKELATGLKTPPVLLTSDGSVGYFVRHLRVNGGLIVVDGTHLTGKYKGVLLTASGQDANCQVYPLAFAVVDSENVLSWTWFFEKLEAILADSSELTIISDRHNAIYAAKKQVFPKASGLFRPGGPQCPYDRLVIA